MAGQDDLGSKLNDINFQGGNTIDEARAPTTPQSDLVMGNCSQCGEQTSKHCTGCKDAPPYGTEDDSSITFFCGQECQLAGWRNHQNLCKRRHLRKKLRLAAWMIDIAWHKYREKVYDFAIDRVENKDGMLLAYESDRKAWLEKEGNYVWQFPQSLVANDEDKRALLDLKVDIDAFADMHELISPLMQSRSSQSMLKIY